MIVIQNLRSLFDILRQEQIFSFDCETTGLKWQKGDYAFLWSFATKNEEFVYDLRSGDPSEFYAELHEILLNPNYTLIGANPKFDLHMSKVDKYKATVYDVQVMARLCDSGRLKIGLSELAKDIGQAKQDAPKEWIKKNKAYRYERNSLGEMEKIPRYDTVPDEIIYSYAASDARLTYDLYYHYLDRLSEVNQYNLSLKIRGEKDIFNVLEREAKLTKVLFNLEKRGVLLDVEYTTKAFEHERARVLDAAQRFEQLTGHPFVDSAKSFVSIFGDASEFVQGAPRTEKGNLSFTDEYLSRHNSPVAKAIIDYREAYKKCGTYYSSFLDLQDRNQKIHTNLRQASTSTGRLSATDPNLQNVTNDDGSEYSVRGCFIAPDDYYWVSIDFQAQEMRVMLDLAGELPVIKKVIAGEDLHQATADEMGTGRKEAKAINFGLLYGMGVGKLAISVNKTEEEARSLKQLYLRKLPRVADFISQIVRKVKSCGQISNIYGRVFNFDIGFEYKAVNYLIQGSSAEITKNAMVLCEEFLEDKLSKLILSVHDELVFYVHKDELHLVEQLADLMRKSYKYQHLPMDVGIEIGGRWSQLEGWDDFKARNSF